MGGRREHHGQRRHQLIFPETQPPRNGGFFLSSVRTEENGEGRLQRKKEKTVALSVSSVESVESVSCVRMQEARTLFSC